MKKACCIIYLLFLFQISFGQTYNLDNKYKITLPQRADWKTSTHYCDTLNNIYHYIQIRKDFQSKERKFSSITVKYEKPNNDIIEDLSKSDCAMGIITKIDTVNISEYKARRRFGTNCGWLIEDWSDTKIAGYSVDLIVKLDNNAYLRIMSSYFSSDKNELKLIETDLLSLIAGINISRY